MYWFHSKIFQVLISNLFFRALHGFLTRQQTEEYLNKSPNGTFLIRFSDSEPGGVTIAWITGTRQPSFFLAVVWFSSKWYLLHENDFYFIFNIILVNESGQREVAMLQPFTRKDLVIRSLPDRLNDCPQMLYLYPDIPKVIFNFNWFVILLIFRKQILEEKSYQISL